MREVKVKDLKYYKIGLDSTWSGIRELKEDVGESIEKYGFAQSFKPVNKDSDIYKCIVPDEEEKYYLLCQQSISDIKKIVHKHPEIPISNPERETIGDLLYMIDLYCDLYEVINLEDSERFSCWDWCIDPRPAKGSLDEKVIFKKKPNLKMDLKTAQIILEKTGRITADIDYWLDLSNYEHHRHLIKDCDEILRKYGLNLFTFMSKIQIKDGEIYWKAIKYYHLLE